MEERRLEHRFRGRIEEVLKMENPSWVSGAFTRYAVVTERNSDGDILGNWNLELEDRDTHRRFKEGDYVKVELRADNHCNYRVWKAIHPDAKIRPKSIIYF